MWCSQLLYSQQATEPDDAEDGLLENEKGDEFFLQKPNDSKLPRNRQRRSWWNWVLQFAVFLCSLTLFILSRYSEPSDAACTRKLSTYSPALEAVEYHHTTFKGAFDQPSIYRGTPTPELDWQWEELIEGSAFNLPSDKLHLLNISETDIPRWHHTEPRFGGGVAASGWGFHQIHCLNVLRQISYKEEYAKQGRLPQILRQSVSYRRDHVDHCIELMRQDLVCQADVTPYFILDAPPGAPEDDLKVDFSIHKKCRDFEKVKRWVRGHTTIESFKDSFVEGLEFK